MSDFYKVVDTVDYRGWLVEIYLSSNGYQFSAHSGHLKSSNPDNPHRLYASADRALADIKSKIDEFLEDTPETYGELADAIQASLIWTGYEECEVDASVLEVIVENFIKARK